MGKHIRFEGDFFEEETLLVVDRNWNKLFVTVVPLLFRRPSKWHKQDMLGTAGETETDRQVKLSPGILPMGSPMLVDQQGTIFFSSVRTLDAVGKPTQNGRR